MLVCGWRPVFSRELDWKVSASVQAGYITLIMSYSHCHLETCYGMLPDLRWHGIA